MKAKILLLSLAVVLLGACQRENEFMETFGLQQSCNNMEERKKCMKNAMAAMVQINASHYNCVIVEVAVAGNDRAWICVRGTKENLDALFDYVNEAGKE